MSDKFKEIDKKKLYILLFRWHDSKKNLDADKIKVDEKSHKNIRDDQKP